MDDFDYISSSTRLWTGGIHLDFTAGVGFHVMQRIGMEIVLTTGFILFWCFFVCRMTHFPGSMWVLNK